MKILHRKASSSVRAGSAAGRAIDAWDRTKGKEALAEAAVQLVASHGLEGVSVRKVATHAGVSAGLVQHHYATKQALVLAAMHQVDSRVQQRLGRIDQDQPPAQLLRALALQIVPLDEERLIEARVWLAFIAAAGVDPTISEVHSATWQRLEDALATLIGRHHGRHHPERLDRDRAALLLAGLDGLAVAAVSEAHRLPFSRVHDLAEHLADQAIAANR